MSALCTQRCTENTTRYARTARVHLYLYYVTPPNGIQLEWSFLNLNFEGIRYDSGQGRVVRHRACRVQVCARDKLENNSVKCSSPSQA